MLPNAGELFILGTIAVLCAVVFGLLQDRAGVLVVLAFPLLLVSMLMGARRTGQLSAQRGSVEPERVEQSA